MRSSVQGQASDLRSRLAEGRAVCLFPEGTTERPADPALPAEPVRLALPALAGRHGAAGGARLSARDADDAAWIGDEAYELSDARRFLERPGRLDVTIRFLDPIDPAAAGDRKTLAARPARR